LQIDDISLKASRDGDNSDDFDDSGDYDLDFDIDI
jgi:hypothetical protein